MNNKTIEWSKVNIITGLNGVGKSVFLNNINDFFPKYKNKLFDWEPIKKLNFLKNICEDINYDYINWYRHSTPNTAIRLLINNISIDEISNFDAFIFGKIKSINIGDTIAQEIASEYKNLESRIIKFYNKMMNAVSREVIDGNGTYKNSKYNEFEYVKIKNAIDNFLCDKYINGLNEDGNKVQIKDLKNDQYIYFNQLSDGEKQLFAIASMLLENENNSSIYVWDEPELFLNPSWQRSIVPFVERLIPDESMLIIATHSLDVLSTANQYSSKIFELSRDSNGITLNETKIFDSNILVNEFLGGFKNLKEEIKGLEKFILVEGKTDQLYIESILGNNNNNIKVLAAGSASKILNLKIGINSFNNRAKILSIFDNDVNNIFKKSEKHDNEINQTIIYSELKKGEAIEKILIELMENKSEYEYKGNKYKLITNTNDIDIKELTPCKNIDKEKVISSKLKSNGFIDSELFKHKTKILPSKKDLAQYITEIMKDELKEKLEKTLEAINKWFE